MKLCILCSENEAIKNSHIIPKFVYKRLKKIGPVNYLRHTDNPDIVKQDGLTDEYLCKDCELKFSKWEHYFCNNLYDPYDPLDKQGRKIFDYKEELGLFTASLHFRYMKHLEDKNPKRDFNGPMGLYDGLKQICLTGDTNSSRVWQYMTLLGPVTKPTHLTPGINTYFFTSTDGFIFPQFRPSCGEFFISYICIPNMIFLASNKDLRYITTDHTNLKNATIKKSGKISTINNKYILSLNGEHILDRITKRIFSQTQMSENNMKKDMDTIIKDLDFTESLAHKIWELDMALF